MSISNFDEFSLCCSTKKETCQCTVGYIVEYGLPGVAYARESGLASVGYTGKFGLPSVAYTAEYR